MAMNNLKRFWLLFAIPLFLNGCNVGGSSGFVAGRSPAENNASYTGHPVTGDMLVLNLLDEPEILNPYISSSASASAIYDGYLFESFLAYRREPPWDYIPKLVTEMPETSDDHLMYKWKLRDDIYWHDSKPMTMRDAVFTLKAIMNPYVDDLPSKPYYSEIDSLQMADDYSLTMYCYKPYFLHESFLGGFAVMPKHIYDPEGLMDDISFFQITNGSVFGWLSELFESDSEASWSELPFGVAIAKLHKSLDGKDEDELNWKRLQAQLPGLDNQNSIEQYNLITGHLEGLTDGADALESLIRYHDSVIKVLTTLPLATEISELSRSGGFPKREQFIQLCSDFHTKIEKFGEQFNVHPENREPTIASGPFKFESWSSGQEIVIRRNENYWGGAGHAYLDKIVWRVLTDYTASLVALKSGETDFMPRLQTIQYLTMTNRDKFLDKFIKGTYITPSYTYLGWRNSHPIFADKRVRRAMTHMVRREDFRDKLLFGFAEIVTGPFYRYGADYDSTIVPWKYNPELALELLTEAGWADTDDDGILDKDSLTFKFEMMIPSGSTFAEQATSVLREDLFMLGIEMTIRRLEWSVFINNYIRNHNFDACYLGWAMGLRGDPKQIWHSVSGHGRGSNHIQFDNVLADSLIDAGRMEFDQEKRTAIYKRFQAVIHDEQPYTFMLSEMRKPAYDSRFKGVKWYPFRPGYQFDEWFVPKAEQKH